MKKGLKIRGKVIDIADPKNLGRIKVKLTGFNDAKSETPWAWPCAPFAGNLYGLYCLPVVDDEVWVEQTYEGDWVYTGFFWSERNAKPEAGSADIRIFRTPSGHELKFDEAGSIEILNNNGSYVLLKPDGKVEVSGTEITLNDGAGVVTQECLCSFTGSPHPQASLTVKAKGPF